MLAGMTIHTTISWVWTAARQTMRNISGK